MAHASHSEILEAAANLLAQPNTWTQHTFARDKHGNVTDSYSPNAVCWCLIGAIERVSARNAGNVLNCVYDVLPDLTAAGFNDTPGRTQSEVVNLLRKAAQNCASRPIN